MISLLWAMDENRAIGRNNQLPWHLPEDLKYFKRVTMGKPIAMGRKTYDSIGRPLPGRENIVITRNQGVTIEGCTVIHDVKDLLKRDDEELFVIGGAEIFKEILPFADRLYVTEIREEFEADTFFPEYNLSDWELIESIPGVKDEKNPYDYEFLVYQRKQ
ncbi:dihydrofolate reductase DfrA [Mycobacteroides abscessus subsp. abscessus]|nr:dihydrofolate reductase DfrA [Mycobacteroides abscessus subsp. abscessus]